MSISFGEIPADNLVPMFMTEFDNSNAAKGGAMPWKNLLIGQAVQAYNPETRTESFRPKSDNTGTLKLITSDEQADALYGAGSQIARMIRAFRKNTRNSELWALAVADGSTAAEGEIAVSFAGSATVAPKSGAIRLMIGGQSVAADVVAGKTAAEVATAIAAAINENQQLPVVAEASSATVTLTAKNGGICGQGIDIRYNHYQGQELPQGVQLAITAMTGGGSDTSYVTANVANIIRGTWFNAIVAGSDDATNVAEIKRILDDRWTATVQQTGVLFFSLNGCSVTSGGDTTDYGTASLDALVERGGDLNSQVICLPSLPETPTPGFEVAAAVLGCVAPKALNDPAQPLSNWAVAGIVAPRETDREDLEGNNLLLKAGCALLTCGNDGTVYLKRMVTTYKTNPAGAKDTSYQQLEKVFTLSFLRWDWNNYLAGRYPHAKLADDGTDFGPGQVIMTPKLGEAELLGRYEYWISKGLVQDYATFKANLVVARDPDDDTALQFLIPADLIDQFFIGKSKIQFK
ncbi:MAG: hypothetical protein IKM81_10700 [Fibrobacter sp.]|nr:hypothetical protein [Fibrobacter sp.]